MKTPRLQAYISRCIVNDVNANFPELSDTGQVHPFSMVQALMARVRDLGQFHIRKLSPESVCGNAVIDYQLRRFSFFSCGLLWRLQHWSIVKSFSDIYNWNRLTDKTIFGMYAQFSNVWFALFHLPLISMPASFFTEQEYSKLLKFCSVRLLPEANSNIQADDKDWVKFVVLWTICFYHNIGLRMLQMFFFYFCSNARKIANNSSFHHTTIYCSISLGNFETFLSCCTSHFSLFASWKTEWTSIYWIFTPLEKIK